MATAGILLSNHLSTISAKSPAYATITVTEVDDARPPTHASVTVTEIDDVSPFEVQQQSITTAVKDFSYTQSTAFDFTTEADHYRHSFKILNVLEKYGRHGSPKAPSSNFVVGTGLNPPAWIGKHRFLSHVYHHVRQAQPVQLTLPAFPCKSLNRVNKVLGHLPDLGEELALCLLHAMAKDVEKVYTPGAQVNIASDGVLFNDILGITDEDCWDYGEALNAIILDKGLTTIKFTRCMNLLGLLSDKDTNRDTYLTNTEICRQDLERRFGPSEEVLTNLIKSDKDTSLTYCGMVKFLESEMETSAALVGQARAAKIRVYKKVAKKMMQRSEAFTSAIRTFNPLHVRLSMHPSSGAFKLSIPLIPTVDGNFQKSPWHSCVAVGLDGSYRCVHVEDVRDSHDLVCRNGRPYFYRER